MGPIISKITRGFQIWPQNSNRITFDPFWPKNFRKLAKSDILASFRYFIGQNWDKLGPAGLLHGLNASLGSRLA